jgi:hypothetical protein
VNLVQKQSKENTAAAKTSQYQAVQAQKTASQTNGSRQDTNESENPEKLLETHIDICGIAPSDLQVARYIEQLSNSSLLDNVALVESKEYIHQDNTLRQFKLSAMLRKNVQLAKEDIESIKNKAVNTVWNF